MKSTDVSSDARSAPNPFDLRARLQDELARRCGANAHYSLRAFALDLGIDHATLSQLLRGRRPLTRATAERLGAALGLEAAEIAACARAAESARGSATSAGEGARVLEIEALSAYAAAIVAQWEHLAILELTHVDGFRPDTSWIARVLGIDTDAVTLALNRLLSLGLLEMRDERTWVDLSGPTVLRGGPPDAIALGAAATRALAERVGRLADRRLELPQAHHTTTLAVGLRRVPEALARLRAAHAEIAALLDGDPPREAVYRLETRLHPLADASSGASPI